MAVEITIDYNSDQVIIENSLSETGSKSVLTIGKPRNMTQLQVLIVEIVNAIQPMHGPSIGVIVGKIDEDTRTTVEEW